MKTVSRLISYNLYLRFANDAWIDRGRHDGHGLRRGQIMFNVLTSIRPELAEEVRGTGMDPFYVNERIPDFLAWVEGRW